ncbi:MAG TPA: recombinase RecT [Streptosporangiaceae bacterium]|nr:recombinase RecT [Streptosporangiaceae bacterium]
MSEPQTVGAAVAEVQAAPKMLDESRWADVLPAHIGPAKFQRWALGIMQKPDLVEVARTPVGQLSIVTALLDCATLGLEPGRTYHLVPYKGKVTGITDYKGEVELIWRAVQRPVIASLVYSKDTFYMTGANCPPKHDGDWFAEDGRGSVIGGYAYVEFGEGMCSMVVRMTEADFLKHRAKAQTQNVWDSWPESMRLKTLVHQLRKWVPWSAEVRQP